MWKPYLDVTHGWSVRGDLSDEKVRVAVEGVMKDTVAFFGKYLK